jgi:hypothetical protein
MMDQNFTCRSHDAEMMDGDAIGFEDFQKCLRDIEIVNLCTLAYRPTLHWLRKTLRGELPKPEFRKNNCVTSICTI